LAKKAVNIKITGKRIALAVLIIFICFIVYVVVLETFWPTGGVDLVDQWKKDVWQRKSPP